MALIQSPELKTLSDLITLKEIYEGTNCKDIKNAFVTNVFIPEDISVISIKTYNYFTGFVKNVETFNHRTDSTWKLIIYLDYQLYDTYTDKDIGKVKGEIKKYSNINTKPKDNNTLYNTAIKNNYETHKVKLDQLLNLYYLYIKHIIENKDKYTHIKLISYKCDGLNNYKYIGHTSTFGSIMRFIPIFDDTDYDLIVPINISHAISIFFFYEIQKWIESKADIITINDAGYNFSNSIPECETIYEMLHTTPHEDVSSITRMLAGLFGIKKTTITVAHKTEFVFIMNQLINLFSTSFLKQANTKVLNPFTYGIDEIIISIILNLKLVISSNKYYFETLLDRKTLRDINFKTINLYNIFLNILYQLLYNKDNEVKMTEESKYNYNVDIQKIIHFHRYISIKKIMLKIIKRVNTLELFRNTNNITNYDEKRYKLIEFTEQNTLYNIYKILYNNSSIFLQLLDALDEYNPLIIINNNFKEFYFFKKLLAANVGNESFINIDNIIKQGKLSKILTTKIIPHYANLHLKKQDPPHQSTTNDDMPFLTFTNNIDNPHTTEEINIDTTKWSTTHFTNIAKLYAHLLKDNEPIYAVDNKQNTIPVQQQSGGFVQQHKLNLKNKIKSNKKLYLRNKTIKYNKKHIASQTRIQLKTSKYYKKILSNRNHI